MCCCSGRSCAEVALFVFGLITFIISIPGIFYSAVFWLFTTAFSAGQGWFLGLPFVIMFCTLLATGILETFYGAGICCRNDENKSCRKCALYAAIVLRLIIVAILVFILIFFANLSWFLGTNRDPYVAPPPFPPSSAPAPPPPYPPYPGWPPLPPSPPKVAPDYPPYPPRLPQWPHDYVWRAPPAPPTDYSGVTVLVVWMVVVFAKLLVTLALNIRVLCTLKAHEPPMATGVPIQGAEMAEATKVA